MAQNYHQDKSEMARVLAEGHHRYEPTITRVFRITSDQEDDVNEPVKLLEVNPETAPSGIVPIAFGAVPPNLPFPSVVIELTEDEFNSLGHTLALPAGWVMGEQLYPRQDK